MKTRVTSPLLALAALVLIVCGGQPQDSPLASSASVPPASSPTPTQTATPILPSPTPTPLPPTPTATVIPTPTSQAADSLLEDKTFAFLERLTNEYSPRESATDEELAAALFLRNRLEDLGYDVYVQDFEAARLSAKVEFSSSSAADAIQTFPIAGSIERTKTGTLADVGKAFHKDIPDGGLDGKVALIERGDITFQEKVDRAARAGAAAAIVFNAVEGNFGGRFMERSTIPAVSLARADGLMLLDLMEQGQTTATVSIAPTSFPSRNVISEKPGSSESADIVIVGAHYDTTPDTQGANDNGSGVSALMTIAEIAADTQYPFTLRFVLFGSEEIGLFGSRHYVNTLTDAEIENAIAMINFDVPGSGDHLDFVGSPELTDRAIRVASEIGAQVADAGLPEGASSDHAPFHEAGIPVIFILANDLSRINSPADDIRWINPTLMAWSADIGIRLLDRLADESAP